MGWGTQIDKEGERQREREREREIEREREGGFILLRIISTHSDSPDSPAL